MIVGKEVGWKVGTCDGFGDGLVVGV
jgi:hypothetical protein